MGELGTIIIPYWLKNSLAGRGIGLDSILNYQEAKQALSFEERVELILVQNLDLPVFKGKELGASAWRLLEAWEKTAGTEAVADLAVVRKEYEKRNDAIYKSGGTDFLRERYMQSSSTVQDSVSGRDESNAVAVLSSSTGTVVFLVPDEGTSRISMKQYFDLTERMIEVFYTYGRSFRVMRTPAFQRYLSLMTLLRE